MKFRYNVDFMLMDEFDPDTGTYRGGRTLRRYRYYCLEDVLNDIKNDLHNDFESCTGVLIRDLCGKDKKWNGVEITKI